MATVKSNNMSYSICDESALGVAAAPWTVLEVNDVSEIGRKTETATRKPITKNRQRQGGEIVKVSSGFGFTADLTMHHLLLVIGAALRCKASGPGLTDGAYFRPTAVTATGYTVASGGALTAGTLVYASGFTTAANNGLKVVTSGSTGTEIHAAGLAIEANTGGAAGTANDAKNATLAICGVQGGAGDLEINASGNLESTTLDFTTLGLSVGQWIYVGGGTTGTEFANDENNGFRRITAIAAHEITYDKALEASVTDAGATKTIQLFFGTFYRNYATDHAKYTRPSHSVEATYPDLGGVGTPKYLTPEGNVLDELTIQMPLNGLATMTAKYVGTDTPAFSLTQSTGANNPRRAVMKSALNTSSRIVRVRATDLAEVALTNYLEGATLTIKNGCTAKYVLGSDTAIDILEDDNEADLATTIVLSDSGTDDAARDYDKVTTEFILHNDDGAVVFDMPAVRVGNTAHQVRRGDAVGLQATFQAEQDLTFDYSLGVSVFPYTP